MSTFNPGDIEQRPAPAQPATLAQRGALVFCLGGYAPNSALFLLRPSLRPGRAEVYFFLSARVRGDERLLAIGLFNQERVLNAFQLERFHRFDALAPAHGSSASATQSRGVGAHCDAVSAALSAGATPAARHIFPIT
jgi:hypothetical protein